MAKKKQEKKTRKPSDAEVSEALMDDLDRFEYLLTNYWRHILYGCVAVVLAVALGTSYVKYRRSAALQTEAAIANAGTVETLTKALADHPDSKYAAAARTRLAMLYTDQKEYEKALSVLRQIVKSSPKGELKWRAMLNTAYILEMQDKKNEAIEKFTAIGADSSYPKMVRIEANYGAGRLNAELGRNSEAKKLLELAIGETDTSDEQILHLWSDQAKGLLDRMKTGAKMDAAPPSTQKSAADQKSAPKTEATAPPKVKD